MATHGLRNCLQNHLRNCPFDDGSPPWRGAPQHSFCYSCLRQFFQGRGESCPRCRHPARWRDVHQNHELAEIVDAYQSDADEDSEDDGDDNASPSAARRQHRHA